MESAPVKDDLIYVTHEGTVRHGYEISGAEEIAKLSDVLGRIQYEWKCKGDDGNVYREFVTSTGAYVSDGIVVDRDTTATVDIEMPLTEDKLDEEINNAQADPSNSPLGPQTRHCDFNAIRENSWRIIEMVNLQVRMFTCYQFYSYLETNDRPAGANQKFRINLPDDYHSTLRTTLSVIDGLGGMEAKFAAQIVPETITVEIRLSTDASGADAYSETGPEPSQPGGNEGAHETSIDPAQMAKTPEVDFSDVAAMEDLKQTFEEDVILPIADADLYEQYDVGMVNGVLLYGPPGTGKSYVSEALAGELGYNYLEVSGADITGGIIGQTARNIQALFDYARHNQPCILFFDEFDNIATDRSETSNTQSERQAQNQLLQELSAIGDEDILVIAATNKHEELDSAAIRRGRFDRDIEVPPPGNRDRLEILYQHLEGRPFDGSTVNEQELANATFGFSAAGMKALADQAARYAVRDHRQTGRRQEITHTHLMQAADEIEREYDDALMRKYDHQPVAGDDAIVMGPASDDNVSDQPVTGDTDGDSFVEVDFDESDDEQDNTLPAAPEDVDTGTDSDAEDAVAGAGLLEESSDSDAGESPEAIGNALIPVRNDLWRALNHEGEVKEGVEMTLSQLDDQLAEFGVDIISPDVGESTDPRRHQVTHTQSSDRPDGTITEVVEPGYEIDGTVKEPAKVVTSDGPAE